MEVSLLSRTGVYREAFSCKVQGVQQDVPPSAAGNVERKQLCRLCFHHKNQGRGGREDPPSPHIA
jgi:hypothetical protein